jgi:hypothetical protein
MFINSAELQKSATTESEFPADLLAKSAGFGRNPPGRFRGEIVGFFNELNPSNLRCASLWRCGPEMQWFSSGSGPSSSSASTSQPSPLAEWNSYAASRSAEDDAGDGFGIDIEAAVRSANDRVAGTFGM